MKIYKLTNRATGKSYIGKTSKTLADRRHIYCSDAKRLKGGGNDPMLVDIAKHGAQNMVITLIEECDEAVANEQTHFWIGYFMTLEPNGYNRPRE